MPSGQRCWRTSAKHLASSNSPERLTRSDAGMIAWAPCMRAAANQLPPSFHQTPRASATRSSGSQHPGSQQEPRLFVEAVLYRYRAGIPWRDLPQRFGDGVHVQRRFSRWAVAGVWERVFQHLAAEADNEYAMIDSTIVRAHQHSAGAQKKLGWIKPSGDHAVG